MVKGTVLRGVAVMEGKDEILFDPWLEMKLVFLLIDSELGPNDFDSAELNCSGTKTRHYYRWYQKMVFPDSKRGTGC